MDETLRDLCLLAIELGTLERTTAPEAIQNILAGCARPDDGPRAARWLMQAGLARWDCTRQVVYAWPGRPGQPLDHP